MADKGKNKRKRLILAFFIILLASALLVKTGFFLYQRYWQNDDGLIHLLPSPATAYLHINLDTEKEKQNNWSELLARQGIPSSLNNKWQEDARNFFSTYDLTWPDQVTKQINREIAWAEIEQEEKLNDLILLKTKNPLFWEREVLQVMRQEKELIKEEYREIPVNCFERTWPEIGQDSFFQTLNHWPRLCYTILDKEIAIGSSSDPLQLVIDTYKEKSQQAELDSSQAGQAAYGFLSISEKGSLPFFNQELFDFRQVLVEQSVDQIFFHSRIEPNFVQVKGNSDQGFWRDWNFSQPEPLPLSNYLPENFVQAIFFSQLTSFEQLAEGLTEQNIFTLDKNSLLSLNALLPEKSLISMLEKKSGLLLVDDSQKFVLSLEGDTENLEKELGELSEFIKNTSAMTNPATRDFPVNDQEAASELFPQVDQVIVQPASQLGEDFFSVPFYQDKLFYGHNGQDLFVSNSFEFLQSSLSGGSGDFTGFYQTCLEENFAEVYYQKINNLKLPGSLLEFSGSGKLILGNSLDSGKLQFTWCFFPD